MKVTIDEDQLHLMLEALGQADSLVTVVIRGETTTLQGSAFAVARTLNELKRKFGILKDPTR